MQPSGCNYRKGFYLADSPLLASEHIAPAITRFFESQGIPLSGSFPLAGEAGSGRKFYRIRHDNQSWVLLVSPAVDADFHRFTEYGRFFCSLGLPVPCHFAIDGIHGQVLQEDMGDTHLYAMVKNNGPWEKWYYEAIQTLVLFQQKATARVSQCPTLKSWQFDFKGLRWETSYFTDNFVKIHIKPSQAALDVLSREFDMLARRVEHHPRVVMHRDFQSQNILIYNNKVGIIDFQGARMGSIYYDLASLLWDPYTELPVEFIDNAFNYFCGILMPKAAGKESRELFLEASLQRLMQACGAYCFLSQTKGITYFAQYLKPGLSRLKLVLERIKAKELLNMKKTLLEMIANYAP